MLPKLANHQLVTRDTSIEPGTLPKDASRGASPKRSFARCVYEKTCQIDMPPDPKQQQTFQTAGRLSGRTILALAAMLSHWSGRHRRRKTARLSERTQIVIDDGPVSACTVTREVRQSWRVAFSSGTETGSLPLKNAMLKHDEAPNHRDHNARTVLVALSPSDPTLSARRLPICDACINSRPAGSVGAATSN